MARRHRRQYWLLVAIALITVLFFVCLLLHAAQVHYILGELCFGGLALETNMAEILAHLDEQNKLEKQEVIDRPTKPNSLRPLVLSVLYSFHFSCTFSNVFLLFCHVGTSYSSVRCIFFRASFFGVSNFPAAKLFVQVFCFLNILTYMILKFGLVRAVRICVLHLFFFLNWLTYFKSRYCCFFEIIKCSSRQI